MRSEWALLSGGQRRFLIGWAAFLVAASSVVLIVMGGQQYDYRQESIARHAARIADGGEGRIQAARTPPPGNAKDVARVVRVGVYVDRIPEFSIIGSAWKADFYVWFDWEGDDLDPGESFQVVNGEILGKTLLERSAVAGRHYALYRLTAAITKSFDVARFPRDDHLLTIALEDTARQSYQIEYVADAAGSDISSRVAVPGYEVLGKEVSVQPHSYRTARGNPQLPTDYRATYSQFVYGIWVARPSWGLHFKMFIVMYGAVFIALLGSFVRDSSDRLALVAGSLFAAVANMYISATLIPDTGIATLADQINWIGAGFIIVAVVQAVIYQRCFEGRGDREVLSRLFDRTSFALMAACYLALNVGIPVLASV